MRANSEQLDVISEADFDLDRILRKHRWWMFLSMVMGVVILSGICIVVAKLT